MTNLLDGIRVFEWTQPHHGAGTGYMLGDLGADVIKVEDPAGDIARTWPSILGVSPEELEEWVGRGIINSVATQH